MKDFKFELGEIVGVGPIPNRVAAQGKVIAKGLDIDGGRSYTVTITDPHTSGVARHSVSEHEIHKVKED